jgi:hypothetical protein
MPPSSHRIYRVCIADVDATAKPEQRLIRAANSSQARRHVADSRITVDLATQDECVELAAAGVKVENAGASEP